MIATGQIILKPDSWQGLQEGLARSTKHPGGWLLDSMFSVQGTIEFRPCMDSRDACQEPSS